MGNTFRASGERLTLRHQRVVQRGSLSFNSRENVPSKWHSSPLTCSGHFRVTLYLLPGPTDWERAGRQLLLYQVTEIRSEVHQKPRQWNLSPIFDCALPAPPHTPCGCHYHVAQWKPRSAEVPNDVRQECTLGIARFPSGERTERTEPRKIYDRCYCGAPSKWEEASRRGAVRCDGLPGTQRTPTAHHLCCCCGCVINRHRLNVLSFLPAFNKKSRRLGTARAMHLAHTHLCNAHYTEHSHTYMCTLGYIFTQFTLMN